MADTVFNQQTKVFGAEHEPVGGAPDNPTPFNRHPLFNFGASGGSPANASALNKHMTDGNLQLAKKIIALLMSTSCTRATTRTVCGYDEDAVIADGMTLLTVPINIPAFTGGRLVGSTWYATDAAGAALSPTLSNANSGTNYLLQSATPATQTTGSLGTGTYTLSVYGAGSALASGGTATITGAAAATEGAPNTITVTVAGTVTVTVTGVLTYFQLEGGTTATPIILTTTTALTRAADINTVPTPSVLTAVSGAIEMVFTPTITGAGNRLATTIDANNRTLIYGTAGATGIVLYKSGETLVTAYAPYTPTAGVKARVRVYWGGGFCGAAAINDGGSFGAFTVSALAFPAQLAATMLIGSIGAGTGEYESITTYASKEAAGW